MKNKKKGFTLIELIAVIAILAILGAVLVPKIAGYQAKAKRSNIQSTAKVIQNAIKAYNSDAKDRTVLTKDGGAQGEKALDVDTVSFITAFVNTANGKDIIDTTNADYTKLSTLTIDKLCGVANGDFTVSSAGVVSVTTVGTIE